MIIEVAEKGSKAFYREVVNLAMQVSKVKKHPEKKISDEIGKLLLISILSAVLVCAECMMLAAWGIDPIIVLAMGIMVSCFVFSVVMYIRMTKLVDHYLNSHHHSTLILDETGIELKQEGAQTLRLVWENIALVKTADESVSFISVETPVMCISITKIYEQQVINYLNENHPEIKVA